MLVAEGVVVKLRTMSFFKFGSYGSFVTFDPGKITTLSDPDVLTSVFVGVRPGAKYPLNVSKGGQRDAKLEGHTETLVDPLFSPAFVVPDRETGAPMDPGRVSGTIFSRSGMRFVVTMGVSMSPEGVAFVETVVGTAAGGPVRVWFGAVISDICVSSTGMIVAFRVGWWRSGELSPSAS